MGTVGRAQAELKKEVEELRAKLEAEAKRADEREKHHVMKISKEKTETDKQKKVRCLQSRGLAAAKHATCNLTTMTCRESKRTRPFECVPFLFTGRKRNQCELLELVLPLVCESLEAAEG